MKRITVGVLVFAGLCSLLAGCKNPNDISNASRTDQEKAFQGDPVRGQQIGQQMRARYLGRGGPASAPQAGAQPGGAAGR